MLGKVFIVIFLFTTGAHAASNCAAWSALKPKLDDLKKIIACGPQYTSQECQDNLGYLKATTVGKIVAAGAVAGARAGRNIEINPPKVCGLFSMRAFWFESVAFAGCQSQVADSAKQLKEVLENSQSIRRAELGAMLTERLAKEEPKLEALSSEVARAYTKSEADLDAKLKALNEKLKPLEVKFTSGGQCLGPKETCNKLWSLSLAKSAFDTKESIATNADRLSQYYSFDREVQTFKANQEAAQNLIRRVDTGRVVTEAELTQLFSETKKNIHPSMNSSLADTGDKIICRIPTLKGSALADTEPLKNAYGAYLKTHAGRLKKILPFALASLVGVAGGASAAEVAEDFIPLGLSPTTLGCAERFSKYAPPTDENCKPNSTKLTEPMKDFLTLDEEEQMQEICSHPSLQANLQSLHRRYFQSLELVCASDSVTVKKQERPGDFFATYAFSGSNIRSANITTREIDGLTGYRLQFGNDGIVKEGQFVRSRSTTNITKGSPYESTAAVGEDFALKQALAYAGQECCADGASQSCRQFKVTGSGASTGRSAVSHGVK